jgi:hypothetical protein
MSESEPFNYGPAPEHLMIKQGDHFYISAHGVEGIRLRVDSATIEPLQLKIKLMELTDAIMKYL